MQESICVTIWLLMQAHTLVIFGITSNLAQRYLIPALYDMEVKGVLPKSMAIVGNSRSPYSKTELTEYLRSTLNSENKHHKHHIDQEVFERLADRFFHLDGNVDDPEFYTRLKTFLLELAQKGYETDNKVFYLATYPSLYQHVFENLENSKLSQERKDFVKVIIEKPIGTDLDSAKKLNHLLHKYFKEDQIFRLDHYLGKETLLNILSFRFGNSIFEPLLNKDYIDHIQITATEDYGIGNRGGYFDGYGMLKDVGQNHQLQMLAFATMEAPSEFTNKSITSERLKLLESLKPEEVVFGQYEGYREEKNVAKDSEADTFYALKTTITNKRFNGVPVYIRAGKFMEQSATYIAIVFKNPVNKLFDHMEESKEPNILIYSIYPTDAIALKISTKMPGQDYTLEPSYMQFCYPQSENTHFLPDEHERLITHAIAGDQTFFNDALEVEAQWKFIDPLVAKKTKPIEYPRGSWGPKEADQLIEKDKRKWLEPSTNFCKF